ncbi:MAG: ABC transporter ATP-binding protein [Geminicoccaceae bacterium]
MTYLSLDRLSKGFARKPLLKDVSLDVPKGETVVIFGPSGCGKTVLLRLISGIMEPDSGDVRIDGASVLDKGPEYRDVGMAFQNFALYPHLPAYENIASPLRAGGVGDAEIQRRVGKVAELLKISHVLKHLPRELSNGQKQRTALARSLVKGPSVLLLDDPLRNVDAKLRYEMRLELPRVLREVRSTVLYVTQDYKEAMALGDRVGVLYDGTFRQIDRPGQIYRDPDDVRIARLFGDPTINLYPVRPTRTAAGLVVSLFGDSVPLPASHANLADRACLIGLRPEDVAVALDEQPGTIPVELDAVTPLSVRTVLFLRARDRSEILATTSEQAGIAFGRGHRPAFARIDTGRALFFDEATGARLRPAA